MLIILLFVMAFLLVVADGFLVMRRVKIEAPYVRPTIEEEEELLHGMWTFKSE